MLRTVIPRDSRALLFREGDFKRLLMPGKHFVFPGYTCLVFKAVERFLPPMDLNILLEDAALAAELEIVEVKQNEIAVVFADEICTQVLMPGKHAFWKGVKSWRFRHFDRNQPRIPDDLDRHALRLPEVIEQIQVFSVAAHEKGGLFIDRKFIGLLDPGDHVFWRSALSVEVLKADLRLHQAEVPSQELLTKDRVTVRINFVFQYRIADPLRFLTDVQDAERQIYSVFQLALREFIGGFSLDEILQKKDEIGPIILKLVESPLQVIGVQASMAGVKDVILPGEIRDILNQVLIAEKRAQANVITRREETASTRNLLNTVRLMEENPLMLRLKELEYVERLAEKVKEIHVGSGDPLLHQLKTILLAKQDEQ